MATHNHSGLGSISKVLLHLHTGEFLHDFLALLLPPAGKDHTITHISAEDTVSHPSALGKLNLQCGMSETELIPNQTLEHMPSLNKSHMLSLGKSL